jgi:hypothetical protein
MDQGYRDPFTTVAGDVCEPCNTGWMHELEESSRPLLGHFIQGDARNIRFWRQALVATWAIKTAMVWECVSPNDRTIPLVVLRAFHVMQRPGMRQQVWLGRYAGEEPHSFQRTAGHAIGVPPRRPDVPDEAHAYFIAINVGQLALAVCGHLLQTESRFKMPTEFAASLIPIWPPTIEVVKWPPAETIDYIALQACVRSLGEPIQANPQAPET